MQNTVEETETVDNTVETNTTVVDTKEEEKTEAPVVSTSPKKDSGKIQTTGINGGGTKVAPTNSKESADKETVDYLGEDGKESKAFREEAEEAKKDETKEVTALPNPDEDKKEDNKKDESYEENPTYVITENNTEEEKAENNNEDGSTESSWKDMLSNATVAEPEKVE